MSAGFNKWLDTFLDEKGIDLKDQIFTCDIGGFWGHCIMEGGVLLDALRKCPKSEEKKIKATIVKLDFCNAPVLPFFQHLACGLAKQRFGGDTRAS